MRMIPLVSRLGSFSLLLALIPCLAWSNDPIYEAFQDPSPEMRPFARWWWNGSRVNSEETIRQLDVMREAGIMGVEINTIGMPDYLEESGFSAYPELEWLGPEWTAVVMETVAAAKERGMTADIIVGSGWPFGGEFLEPEEQTQRVRLVKLVIEGPITFKAPIEPIWEKNFRSEIAWKNRGLRTPTELKLRFLRLVPEDHGKGGFTPGEDWVSRQTDKDEIVVEVPAGRHVLHVGLHEIGFTGVKLGAPGADGPVVDHYNGHAVRRYLDRMSDTIEEQSGKRMGELFRATFVDSLELDHANWTTDFPEQFEERCGYSIDPYLPFVLDLEPEEQSVHADFRDTVERARYDFVRTLLELFEERFLRTYVRWASDNGLKARIQAYGRETHPLHGSMEATLPEGETWLWLNTDDDRRIWAQSTVANKYVSSGAHLSGKRLVSFEAMTNAVPVFRATLHDFKRGMDLSILDGLNHPILHGFNYFPKDIEYPGWVRFGSYFNEVNPFWPHFRKFSDYVGRMGTLLRNSDYQAQVAMLSPRGEEWARDYMLYQPFPEVIEPWYQYSMAQAFQKVGFGVDHVSERVLQGAEFVDGEIRFGNRAYQLLVVQDVEAMDIATAEALLKFHKSGGKIVFIGERPNRAHGLFNHLERDTKISGTMERVIGASVFHLPAPVKDDDVIVPGPRGKHLDDTQLIEYADRVRRFSGLNLPVRIANPDSYVSQVHHLLDDGRDLFFFSSRDEKNDRDLELHFSESNGYPVIWDAETGDRRAIPEMIDGRMSLHLEPMESKVIVFESSPAADSNLEIGYTDLQDITDKIHWIGNWETEFHQAADGKRFARSMEKLVDLSLVKDDQEVSSFGGRIVYRNTFEYVSESEPSLPMWLDLGEANGTVSLKMNGQAIGTSWYGQHRFEISGALKSGLNRIEIEVTTVLANDLKARTTLPAQQRWASWYKQVPTGLQGPVRLTSAAPRPF